jgi:teichoic acid transport system permease protein
MINTLKEIFVENVRCFSCILRAGWVDVQKDTDGAFLGWFWLVAKPVIYVAMFSVAMGVGLRQGQLEGSDAPYIVWLAAGLIPWFCMQRVFSSGSKVFSSKKKLMNLGTFPVVTIPSIAAILGFFVFLVSFAMLLILTLAMGVTPSIYWLQLPLIFICMVVFFYFFSLLSSCLSAVSKDYQKLVGTISMAFFWTSGILFDISHINNPLFNTYLALNPFTFITRGFREVICFDAWFFVDWEHLLGFGIVVLMTILTSCVLFRRLKTVVQDSR